MIFCEDRRAVRCHKKHQSHMPAASGMAPIPILQQETIKIFKEYRGHEEHTDKAHLPLHGRVSRISQPRCYNLVFPPLGPWCTSLNLLSDVSLPLFSHWGHQPKAETPWLENGQPHRPPGACWAMSGPRAASRAAPYLLLLWPTAILAKPTSSVSPPDVPPSWQYQRKGGGLIATRAVGGLS